jgi:hypothetical protein
LQPDRNVTRDLLQVASGVEEVELTRLKGSTAVLTGTSATADNVTVVEEVAPTETPSRST